MYTNDQYTLVPNVDVAQVFKSVLSVPHRAGV
jgi:hypothetical protein